MKICITGGAGFIGSNLADKYLELGHEVVIIDDLSLGFEKNIPSKAKLYKLDINDEKIIDVFENEKFDIVSHHAAQMSVKYSISAPLNDAKINILGVINILEAARKTGVKKIIFSSSGGTVYGEQLIHPCDEEHQTFPISPYGVSKLSTEKYIQYYHNVFGLDYTIFRYANVYGKRQNPKGEAGVIAIFALKMLNNEDTYLTGNGTITRDYVNVSDVVEANVHALTKKMTGIYNVSTGVETDLNQIFDSLSKIIGYKKPKIMADFKLGEQLRSSCSYEKLHKETGWTPKVILSDGLVSAVEYYKNEYFK